MAEVPNIYGAEGGAYSWPQTSYSYWPQTLQYVAPTEDYANEVEVIENDHDAVLTFYRRRGATKSKVREITVPRSLLPLLAAPKRGGKR